MGRIAFHRAADRISITGYPRNDLLFDADFPTAAFTGSVPEGFRSAVSSGKTVFIYLPTFRDSNSAYLDFDWARLDAFLGEHNAELFYKFHPQERGRVQGRYANVHSLPTKIDIYAILADTTALISDYSSIIFDYPLLDRAILYFVPDLEDFVTSSRSLNLELDEVAVGPCCKTFDELLAAMERTLDGGPPTEAELMQRKRVLEMLHEHTDGRASERVFEAISKVLELN
ncbi:MAG: hypothetical protein GY711_04050 [bacterium]|nr:hypothetical protein [bacterium]